MEITARVTTDAKLNTLKDERQVVNFNVAINDNYKAKGSSEVKKVATFFQCAYWINPGIAKYLTKGTLVELSGRIGVNAYKDKEGEPKGVLTFHVNTIKLHGRNKATESVNITDAPVSSSLKTEHFEDLPF